MRERPDLVVEDLAVRFGGIHAVEGLTLRAPAGAITGLIGPNGAGKTTSFNACTGVIRPAAGVVRLGERVLDGKSSAARAKIGLGRTFQRMELWEGLTVRENVALGLEARISSRRPWGQLFSTPAERRRIDARVDEAIDQCGIGSIAARAAGDLSTGQGRLVELARAVASDFEFLLLDEPSSGLDASETGSFGDILLELATRDGLGILLVEHDMALVRRVCSYLYVLEFGQLLTEGPAADVLSSDLVRAAYLGSEDVA